MGANCSKSLAAEGKKGGVEEMWIWRYQTDGSLHRFGEGGGGIMRRLLNMHRTKYGHGSTASASTSDEHTSGVFGGYLCMD